MILATEDKSRFGLDAFCFRISKNIIHAQLQPEYFSGGNFQGGLYFSPAN